MVTEGLENSLSVGHKGKDTAMCLSRVEDTA